MSLRFTILTLFINLQLINGQSLKIIAKSGDGIHTVLQKHQMDSPDYFEKFVEFRQRPVCK